MALCFHGLQPLNFFCVAQFLCFCIISSIIFWTFYNNEKNNKVFPIMNTCFVKSDVDFNYFLHKHELCFFNSDYVAQLVLQKSHLNGFLPPWTTGMRSFKERSEAKNFSQILLLIFSVFPHMNSGYMFLHYWLKIKFGITLSPIMTLD